LRSTTLPDPPLDLDLFRTVTAGIPASGMPSFSHLPEALRWGLVDHVKRLAFGDAASDPEPQPVDLGAEPPHQPDEHAQGEKIWRQAGCDSCHGSAGRGDGPAAQELASRPADLTLGPGVFKGGATPRDVVRALLTGIPGTPMPSYEGSGLSRDDLWTLGRYVAAFAVDGLRTRRNEESQLLAKLRFTPPSPRTGANALDAKPPKADEDGCQRCHAVEVINDKMQPALLALAGQRPGHTCAICHAGDPDAPSEEASHVGLIADPGSLWVVGLGLGCAQCHAASNSLTTFQGIELPVPVGGRLMSVVSTARDPTGATGSAHVYRVPRGLMAAELGKATRALSTATGEKVGFADVAIDDPDGREPCVGSTTYRQWLARAMQMGAVRPLDRAEAIPDLEAGIARFGNVERAAFADSLRKACLHCHAWDRGREGGGSRVRAEGCSACHVAYDETGHRMGHRITVDVRSVQCAHCHWSGRQAQFRDLHHARGMECIDCHTSVDVHGDGNLYPTMRMAIEIACEDCHGTPEAFPWELPVGFGTGVELPGKRGVVEVDGHDYLMTSRGNARRNLERRAGGAVLISAGGGEREIPLLKSKAISGKWKTDAARVAMVAVEEHGERLACNACHTSAVPRCLGCHLDYSEKSPAADWVGTARNRSTPFEPGSDLKTAGWAVFQNAGLAWVQPALTKGPDGRLIGALPGCSVDLRVATTSGEFRQARFASPDLHSVFHQTSSHARTCASCHSGATQPPAPKKEIDPAQAWPRERRVESRQGYALLMEHAAVDPKNLVTPAKCPVDKASSEPTDDRCLACHGRTHTRPDQH
jgi:hypothetical protein